MLKRVQKIQQILNALKLTDKKEIRKISEMKSKRLDNFMLNNNIKSKKNDKPQARKTDNCKKTWKNEIDLYERLN
jgi:hypothetical protein